MEAKYNRKRVADHIKILVASKSAPVDSDSDTSAKEPQKNKARTGFLIAHNKQGKKTPKHKCYQIYLVLCKNTGMPEHRYK